MNIRMLTRREIIKVYEEYMSNDFPQSEIKPLQTILGLLDKQIYMAYGLFVENELQGYSFLVKAKDKKWILLDYFAICNQVRNLGYGSQYISLLTKELKATGAIGLIIEIEKIECGKSEEEIMLRKRRREFYLRNKVTPVGAFATIFGTEFEILYFSFQKKYDTKKIMDKYTEIYQVMLPKKVYEENCFI